MDKLTEEYREKIRIEYIKVGYCPEEAAAKAERIMVMAKGISNQEFRNKMRGDSGLILPGQ